MTTRCWWHHQCAAAVATTGQKPGCSPSGSVSGHSCRCVGSCVLRFVHWLLTYAQLPVSMLRYCFILLVFSLGGVRIRVKCWIRCTSRSVTWDAVYLIMSTIED